MTPGARSSALLRLAAVVISLTGCGPPRPSSIADLAFPGANLLVISIDTLRADRLGVYGNDRGLTPNLDRLASESVLFETAYSNSPKTASSHMTLFTSMFPSEHGVRNYAPRWGLALESMAPNRSTLGQVLEAEGYFNATIASGGNLNGRMGFNRGFGLYFMSALRSVTDIVSDAKKLSGVLATQSDQGVSWFLFLHTYEVHSPYVPPPEWRKRFASEPRGRSGQLMQRLMDLDIHQQWQQMHEVLWVHEAEFGEEDGEYLMSLYDAEVAYTDAVIGEFLDFLDQRNMLEDTVLVVLSDHGEEFFEHGDFEHDQLYQEHLRVPLIVRLPGGALAGTRVSGMCSLVDVMPTLLDLLAIEGTEALRNQMAGRSLVPSMLSGQTDGGPVFAERVMHLDAYQAALRDEASNVIFHEAEERLEAYRLRSDPGEQRNLSGDREFLRSVARPLRSTLERVLSRRESFDRESVGAAMEMADARLDELEALGYVRDDADGGLAPRKTTPLDRFPVLED